MGRGYIWGERETYIWSTNSYNTSDIHWLGGWSELLTPMMPPHFYLTILNTPLHPPWALFPSTNAPPVYCPVPNSPSHIHTPPSPLIHHDIKSITTPSISPVKENAEISGGEHILGEDWGGGGGWEGFRGPRDTVLTEEPYPEPSIFSSRFRIAFGQVGCPTLSAGFIRRVWDLRSLRL